MAFAGKNAARIAHIFVALGLSSVALMTVPVLAQTAQSLPAMPAAPLNSTAPNSDGAMAINDWLMRMHDASMKRRSYVGTLVQTTPGAISSARIWHACDGQHQIERIDTLTGAARTSIRQNDQQITLMPEIKMVRMEKREGFNASARQTEVLRPGNHQIPQFYTLKAAGQERVAGYEAEVVQMMPRDNLRFGYRLWTERKSAVVLKLQTLDANGQVLEQAAFSELQLDAPVNVDQLKKMMRPQGGWRVEQSDLIKTSAEAEGWRLKNPVPGFSAVSCHKRGAGTSPASDDTLQWVFSDGLATVSLFVENYDKTRHTQEGLAQTGATSTLLRRQGDYFITAVGEVPVQTLRSFYYSLERLK